MIDIHSHILPGLDDGSRSVEESLAMLKASAAQGVGCIAATPHFYAEENSPEKFLERRAASEERLRGAWQPGLPELKLGAEVCFFEGISQCEGLDSLKLEGTDLLLLEMPFAHWSQRTLQEVRAVQAQGITVVLAHIERYLHWQDEETWEALLDWGVLNQCNASFFLHWKTRRKALHMLRGGRIHLLGSDCHNMDARPPQLGKALAGLGARERNVLEENSREFLPDWEEMVR
ncbi:MAG: capsular polysaccharide biosynthesis protein [Clostridiales bacterium]|nr:capsular polysaccharide biosynthesis protein [Clostridiales bacterium]